MLRVSISRKGDKIVYVSIVESTVNEFIFFVKFIMNKHNEYEFHDYITSVNIRAAIGSVNGKSKTIKVNGISPENLKKLIVSEITSF